MAAAQRGRTLIAVCQMTCDNDLDANWKTAESMIQRAVERDAKMIFFPECFDFVGRTKGEQVEKAVEEEGDFIGRFRSKAKQHGIWLSLGGFHNKDGERLPYTTHLIVNEKGETASRYDKLHLFDLDIPGRIRVLESEFSKPGLRLVDPVQTPAGKLATSVCYDMRFGELALWNRARGAEILAFPSAFTVPTGLAHWEVLLRARAIETQCWLVAAAQTGAHNDKRASYGHSMVIDPWGAVVAQCQEGVGMCFAEIDLGYLDSIRTQQPVFAHRRGDLYGLGFRHRIPIDEKETLPFGDFKISSKQVFLRTQHSYAFVNVKPVLPGHVLVAPVREGVKRLEDLSTAETADLFLLTQRVQQLVERVHQTDSSTVCVQDGPQSGQTIAHVHAHILPRKATDFGGSTDTLYKELADHDTNQKRVARTEDDMYKEAIQYREQIEQDEKLA